MTAPVVIEAAINGATPKSRNPHSPRTPDEIAHVGVQAVDHGAAIVHNHNDDPVVAGEPRGNAGWHNPQPYVDAWRQILNQRPDTILYPTMASGGPDTDIAVRYSHLPALNAAGVLGQGLIDPGCVCLGGAGPDGLPNDNDRVYINTYRDARHMFDTCNRMGKGASISIFEPGFLRVVLAYHAKGLVPKGALVKLYFGGAANGPLGFGMMPTEPCLDAYLSMLEPTGLAWSVAVLGGDAVGSGFARLALERGGHVRVGLEDFYAPDRTPTNLELLDELTALCHEVGRPVASPSEARQLLGLPDANELTS